MNKHEEKFKPKCAFPKCGEDAVTTYCQIPLCQKHAEWAEFIRWLHHKLEEAQ